jgi:hypothetical protein
MKMKGALGQVLVGVLVGGGAVWLSSLAVSKVQALQQYPYIAPAILAGTAFLLYKRKRTASALGLAGAVGVLGLFMLQSKGYLQLPAPSSSNGAQTAGVGDAGRMMNGNGNSGWRERPAGYAAGALQGPTARAMLRQQNAMGVGEAGAFMGSAARHTLSAQDAMGLHA